MTPQDLINQIVALPYNGDAKEFARNAFIAQFPRQSISQMSKDQYIKKGDKSTFCYNLEFVKDLPFGIGGQTNDKFGKPTAKGFPNVQGISNMIDDAENGIFTGLQTKHNLNDISTVVLIKILAIYLPDKFLTIGHRDTLKLLASILGISNSNDDLIELNYLCTQELGKLNPSSSQFKFSQLGFAVWEILSPKQKKDFDKWLKKNKAPGHSVPSAYLKCLDSLCMFYRENYYSPNVRITDIRTLYDETIQKQQTNGGKYYGSSPSYGNKYYYSSAVKCYIDYLNSKGGTQTSSIGAEVSQQNHIQPIKYPKNIILYGPPGTGKTYNTIRYAVSIIENLDVDIFATSDTYNNNNGQTVNVKDSYDHLVKTKQIAFTTFHQSLSYEDFIEGIKPEPTNDKKNVLYDVKPGIFKEICEIAKNDSSKRYVLIIDEINRGNVASIFGELITLIESDKREGKPNQLQCILPYSKTLFSVPDNLYIIGTMNTADRSVEALDSALRRRFDFVEMLPDSSKVNFANDIFVCINNRLRILKDSEYQLGHSYFIGINSYEELCTIFKNNVIPLIQEYFYGDMEKIRLVLGDGFCEKEVVPDDLFPNNSTDIDIPTETWKLWGTNKWNECLADIEVFKNALNKLIQG